MGYALLTGVAFLLYGCGTTSTTDLNYAKCELEKFKAASESCYTAIDLPADKCMGLSGEMEKCWEKGNAAGGMCTTKDEHFWFRDIVDKKFASAKQTFKQSVETC